ncbi:MAG: NTP transferase domain-containing protein [Acidobacteria bacterium]|nr:NTP transferase domain-containing protein [Acidobacteriota bacterium]
MAYGEMQSGRCGIVLAGGDGRRLRPFIRRLAGYDLPKQYMSFIGTRSMLEHTWGRAERLIPAERLFTIVARDHLNHAEVQRQVGMRAAVTVVVQPANRETGPGILLPLMHLHKRYPDATVAVFPSDHFILEEGLFAAHVRAAFELVERAPEKIVFLAAEPAGPEPEYGYILPDHADVAWHPARSIKAFIEKPETRMAARFLKLGALWNTMVMVFRPETLIHLVRLSNPALHRSFQRIFNALGTARETPVVERIYRDIPSVNFSRDLLGAIDVYTRGQLSVVPMKGVFWSDWGSEQRIQSVLRHYGLHDRMHGVRQAAHGSVVSAPDAASMLAAGL